MSRIQVPEWIGGIHWRIWLWTQKIDKIGLSAELSERKFRFYRIPSGKQASQITAPLQLFNKFGECRVSLRTAEVLKSSLNHLSSAFFCCAFLTFCRLCVLESSVLGSNSTRTLIRLASYIKAELNFAELQQYFGSSFYFFPCSSSRGNFTESYEQF